MYPCPSPLSGYGAYGVMVSTGVCGAPSSGSNPGRHPLLKYFFILQAHINRILASQYNQVAGPVDGIFGPLTEQGVMRLQQALSETLDLDSLLVSDGIVGPFTREAINNSCSVKV